MEFEFDFDPNASEENYGLPPGFRFCPSDDVLLEYYLAKKVSGEALPAEMIKVMDVYRCNPDDLPIDIDNGQAKWAYFFVFERRDADKDMRHVPGGSWRKIHGSDEAIENKEEGVVIGFKSEFEFWQGSDAAEERKTPWEMGKFRLNDDSSKINNWVVCHIHKSLGT